MKAYLRTDISPLYSWQPVVILIFYLNHKRVDSMILSLDNSLSENHRIICKKRKLSRPILRRTQSRRVQYPLLCFFIKSSSSLQTTYIRTVTYFSLGVTTHNLVCSAFINISLYVLFSAHQLNILQKHGCVG